MLFVKRLRQSQRVFGRKAKPRIRLPLQTRQIEEQWRKLRRWLAFFGHHSRLIQTLRVDRFRPLPVPKPLGFDVDILPFFWALEILVKPAAGIFASFRAEGAMDFPIIFGDKFFNFLFPLDDNCQSRRLHSTHSRQVKTAGLGIEGCHRPSPVNAH